MLQLSRYLSTFVVWDMIVITVLVGQMEPLHTEPGLERARYIVNASMDHTTVVTTLVHSCQQESHNQIRGN